MSNVSQLPTDLPAPKDDGAADHLPFRQMPDLALMGTDGKLVNLMEIAGVAVIYIYPMTGRPGVALPDGWDEIPGARGCTPQSCSFRDHFADLKAAGVDAVFGLSTQSHDYQKEAAERLHLPFPLLSDDGLKLRHELNVPTMEVEGNTLYKRLTLIVRDGVIVHHFYPVFPPDRSAQDVLDYLAGA